jgi:hypothetical protein
MIFPVDGKRSNKARRPSRQKFPFPGKAIPSPAPLAAFFFSPDKTLTDTASYLSKLYVQRHSIIEP